MSINDQIKHLENKLNEKVGENKLNRDLRTAKTMIDKDEYLKSVEELNQYTDEKSHNNIDC